MPQIIEHQNILQSTFQLCILYITPFSRALYHNEEDDF